MNVQRRLALNASLALLVVAAAGPVPALGGTRVVYGDAGIQSCSQAKVILYADANGGDGLVICYNEAIPNLGTYGWDNRVSAVQFYEYTVDVRVCMYYDIGYTAAMFSGSDDFDDSGDSGWWWFPPFSDTMSSVKFKNQSQTC